MTRDVKIGGLVTRHQASNVLLRAIEQKILFAGS